MAGLPERPLFTIWLTGPEGSGKSALAVELRRGLTSIGLPAVLFNNASEWKRMIRESSSAGTSREDLLRLGELCRYLNRQGVAAVSATSAADADTSESLRRLIGEYVEVFCRSERAADPCPGPAAEPDLEVSVETESLPGAAGRIMAWLRDMGYFESPEGYTPEEAEEVRQRLEELGYI